MNQFSAILDKPFDEIDRPKPLPVGTYVCIVQGQPRFDKSARKGTDFVEFTLKPLAALDDVDADDLEAAGGIAEKTIRHTFYLTEDAIYRLKEFLLDHLGIEADNASDAIPLTPGRQVLVSIKHQASDDGTRVYANVAKTAPVE
jgi:hypothetical protein